MVSCCRISSSSVPGKFKVEIGVTCKAKEVMGLLEAFFLNNCGVKARRDKAPWTLNEKSLTEKGDLLKKRAK